MSIQVKCMYCGVTNHAPDFAAGKTGYCTGCKRSFAIPNPMPVAAQRTGVERSESGAPIFHYAPPTTPFDTAVPVLDHAKQLEAHIERHIGKIETVFHEMISDVIHVDVYMVKPTPERNCYTLVTGRMSSRPMKAPEGAEDARWVELMMCLPHNWKMAQEDFADENNYWPIRLLKTLARAPHKYKAWLWFGHTIPNGNPPKPYASETKLCGALLTYPGRQTTEQVAKCEIASGKAVAIFNVVPLHKEEMDLKLKRGVDALLDAFETTVPMVFDVLFPKRPSLV